ncbi:hypothetical protein FACS189452_02700 [Bacteroidia bacterium]|nr:hypothetical protein FACS189452_02700 [Bacteroidia bacterium]
MLISIVIPCYNESKRLNKGAFACFAAENRHIQFLFVNDGSTDNTMEVLERLVTDNENVAVLNLSQNVGKAEAVRQGMLYANEYFQVDYIGFWDADLATPLNEIYKFVTIMQEGNFDVVTGCRLVRLGANVCRKKTRHYLGRIFATVASDVLRVGVYDTQCGAKLYKSDVIKPLFTDKFITRWLFDVEILARYIQTFGRETAINNIYEYPVFTWQDITGSQVKVKDFIKAPVELWKIKRHYLK